MADSGRTFTNNASGMCTLDVTSLILTPQRVAFPTFMPFQPEHS